MTVPNAFLSCELFGLAACNQASSIKSLESSIILKPKILPKISAHQNITALKNLIYPQPFLSIFESIAEAGKMYLVGNCRGEWFLPIVRWAGKEDTADGQ